MRRHYLLLWLLAPAALLTGWGLHAARTTEGYGIWPLALAAIGCPLVSLWSRRGEPRYRLLVVSAILTAILWGLAALFVMFLIAVSQITF